MSIHELQAGLDGLATDRLQRLADRLESSAAARVTIGDWRHCPMALAGFDPRSSSESSPERIFATAWDNHAAPTAEINWRDLLSLTPRRTASRANVQQLLRMVNTTLARRSTGSNERRPHRRSRESNNDRTKHG